MQNEEQIQEDEQARHKQLEQGFYIDDWLIEPLKGTLQRGGRQVRVEPKVMDVLMCLASQAGTVLRRDELLEYVWGDVVVSEEVLTRCISELRSALGDTARTRTYIQTVPKRGYRLLKAVRPITANSDPVEEPALASTQTPGRSFWLASATLLALGVSLTAALTVFREPPAVAATGAMQPAITADTNPAATEQGGNPAGANGQRTVAILPFVNLTGNQETDYFANGLTADVRNSLIRTASNDWRVVARTSSEAFKGQSIDIRSIGQQLGATLIVEGTVRISNERVRVTAQLTSSDDGFPIWADRFEYALEDGLLIQSEIADRIVQQLLPSQEEESTHAYQTNLKAYDYYLLGRHHWNKRNPESLDLADSYFRQALEQDPEHALALVGLADTLILKEEYGGENPENAVELARELASRALQLQSDLAEAHASLGMIASHVDDAVTAEREYRKAVALKPSYSMGRMWLGNLLLLKNEVNEAYEHFRSAIEVDPLNPIVQQNYLRVLSNMGRYDEATQRAEEYFSESRSDHFLKSWMYAMLDSGRYDELLSFAVRHRFSKDYADFGSQIVFEALIMLQRFDEARTIYEQMAGRLNDGRRSWMMATLGTALRDYKMLIQAAVLMEGDDSAENPYRACQQNFARYWRGLSAHIRREYAAAAELTGQALQATGNDCLSHPVRKAEMQAYLIDSLMHLGENERAHALMMQANKDLEYAVDRGRGGLDVAFGKLSLQVASGNMDAAETEIQSMHAKQWQYYAKLSHMPLFDQYQEQLRPSIGSNAVQFAMMQEECSDIGMAKFGL